MRNNLPIFIADADGNRDRCTFGTQDSGAIHGATYNYSGTYIDTPNTNLQITYKIQFHGEGGTAYINRGNEADGDSTVSQRLTSSIVVYEISS
jgi:hypothetical protein